MALKRQFDFLSVYPRHPLYYLTELWKWECARAINLTTWPSNASSTLSRFALNDVSFFAPRDNDVSVFNSVKYN